MTYYDCLKFRARKDRVQKELLGLVKSRIGTRQYVVLMPSTSKNDMNLCFNGASSCADGTPIIVNPIIDSHNRLIMVENGACDPVIDGVPYSSVLKKFYDNILKKTRSNKLAFLADTKLWCKHHNWKRGVDFKGARGKNPDYFDSQIYFHLDDFYKLDLGRVVDFNGNQKVGLVLADFCGIFDQNFLDWFYWNHRYFNEETEFVCTFSLTGQNRVSRFEHLKKVKEKEKSLLGSRKNDIDMNLFEGSIECREKMLNISNDILNALTDREFEIVKAFVYNDRNILKTEYDCDGNEELDLFKYGGVIEDKEKKVKKLSCKPFGDAMLCFLMRIPKSVSKFDIPKESPQFSHRANIDEADCRRFFEKIKKANGDADLGFCDAEEMAEFLKNNVSFAEKKEKKHYDNRKQHAFEKGHKNAGQLSVQDLYIGYEHFKDLYNDRTPGRCNSRLYSTDFRDGYVPLRKLLYCVGHYYYEKNKRVSIDERPYSEFSEYDRVDNISNYIPKLREMNERMAEFEGRVIDIKGLKADKNFGSALFAEESKNKNIYVRFIPKEQYVL